MVWKNGATGLNLTPPHDILEKKITGYLPSGENTKMLLDMMVKSYDILKDHPVNKAESAEDFVLPIPYGSGERVKSRVFLSFMTSTS